MKPRVVMVTPRFLPEMGGIEMHVAEVAPRLVARGFDITVVAADREGRYPARETRDGFVVRRVRAVPRNRDYFFAPEVMRIVRDGRFDLVHCQGYHTLMPPLAMLAALGARLPYVVTFHSGGHASRFRHAARPVQAMLLRPLLARAATLIAVAASERDLFQRRLRLPDSRFRVIANGAHMPPAPGDAAPDPERPLILSVGRLERYKGHHRVLEAMAPLLRRRPTARLHIVGSGSFEPELRDMVARMNLQGSVEVLAVPPDDRAGMSRVLASASVVAFMSEYEAHPVAVMEALALGRPALVADAPGLRDLAATGLATSIDLDASPAQLAEALDRLITDPPTGPPLRLPTWDECADGIAAVYRAALSRSA